MNGQTITVDGNHLEIRYDESTGQSWIEVTSINDKEAIPRHQCSCIVLNKERIVYVRRMYTSMGISFISFS